MKRQTTAGTAPGSAAPPPLKTTVSVDTARTIIARNDSPGHPVHAVHQSVSRLRARLYLLLCAPEPCLPRPVAGPRFRDTSGRQAAGGAAAGTGTAPPGLPGQPDCAGQQYRSVPADRAQTAHHAPDSGGTGRARTPAHHRHQIRAGGARPRSARAHGRKNLCAVFVSVTTLDSDLARQLEPRAAAPHRRLRTIQALAGAGIATGAMFAPA